MRKREPVSPPAIGGTSLLVIFAVLCLTVFSLLSLSTVLAEKRMADASLESVIAYYEADLRAQEIFARLRGGEKVPGVEISGEIMDYSCPISENQQLEVRLQKKAGTWTVLRWQAVANPETAEDAIPVWDGT